MRQPKMQKLPALSIVFIFLSLFWGMSGAQAGWSTPVRISEVTGGYYPDILACGDTLHVVYLGDWPAKIEYIRSTDKGQTWEQRHLLSDTISSYEFFYPRIMCWHLNLICIWRNIFNVGPRNWNVGYAISHDGGATWSGPSYILNPNWAGLQYVTAASYDSLVNVIIANGVAEDFVYFCIRSTDFGSSWSTPQRIFAAYESGIPDCASFDTFFNIVWSGRFDLSHPMDIQYTRSSDGGNQWTPNIALSDTDRYHSQLPAICTGDSGRVLVTWMDYKYTTQPFTGDILLRVNSDSGMIWAPEQQLTFNHFAYGSDVAVSGDTIHVAWEDESEGFDHGKIYYTKSVDGGTNWDAPFWLDQTEDDSHNPALSISGGPVYAIWYDDREPPEGIGLYFSRLDPESDAIVGDNSNVVPDKISLSAYPNPFNSNITFSLYSGNDGDLRICDVNGRLIKKFGVGTGARRIVWDAKGMDGERLPSGVFFVEFRSGGDSKLLKLLFVK